MNSKPLPPLPRPTVEYCFTCKQPKMVDASGQCNTCGTFVVSK